MSITTLLSGLPARTMTQANFDAAVALLMSSLPTWGGEVNSTAAGLNAIAAGGAMAIPYTFSTTTTDSDPGAGTLRLDNATQNAATTIRLDLLGADGSSWTSVLDTFDASTSTVKGYIRLIKTTDATKFLIFSVSARATPSGYRNITVTNVASSGATPFANGDSLILYFTRTGDKGTTGAAGKLLQVVHFDTGAVATGTTVIPWDDTIPQNTEGDQYMTLSITPLSATSNLIIEIVAHLATNNTGVHIAGALFRDSGANALGAGALLQPAVTNTISPMSFTVKAASGSTAATTFNFRAGRETAGTVTFNGESAARKLGGVLSSSMRILEMEV